MFASNPVILETKSAAPKNRRAVFPSFVFPIANSEKQEIISSKIPEPPGWLINPVFSTSAFQETFLFSIALRPSSKGNLTAMFHKYSTILIHKCIVDKRIQKLDFNWTLLNCIQVVHLRCSTTTKGNKLFICDGVAPQM
eukprot:Pompholyxophrys_punicea_v1_NODE_1399_length_737_cov_1.363636.p1 type:complete len:139 gc:universal NODE_1399_length_737_cov_1.363636:619-203(-)